MSTPATTGAPMTPRDRKGSSSGAGGRSRRPMSIRTLWPLLAITFGLTWGLGMLLRPFGEHAYVAVASVAAATLMRTQDV
jgi:hypothetical protein